MVNKSLRQQVKMIKKKKLLQNKVVNLSDYRNLNKDEQSYKILVVDDDEVIRNGLKRILEKEGYEILLAQDGMELAKLLEGNNLDLIFLDINLPWVDGYQLCRLIKGNPTLTHVPVVFISARKTEEDIQIGFSHGCDDYVPKPFEVDQILALVKKNLLKSS